MIQLKNRQHTDQSAPPPNPISRPGKASPVADCLPPLRGNCSSTKSLACNETREHSTRGTHLTEELPLDFYTKKQSPHPTPNKNWAQMSRSGTKGSLMTKKYMLIPPGAAQAMEIYISEMWLQSLCRHCKRERERKKEARQSRIETHTRPGNETKAGHGRKR